MAKSLKAIKALDISDISNMTKAQISEYLKPAAKIVNERMGKFKTRGLSSPASAFIEQHGRIKTTGTRAQMIKELATARRFLLTETGTIKGAQQYIRNMKKLLGLSPRTQLTKEELKTMWSIIDEVKENMQGIGSDDIQKITSEIFIENRNRHFSLQEKTEVFDKLAQHDRFKSMLIGLSPEDISHDKYIVFKSILEIDRKYQQQQHIAELFRLR